ncbi:group I intron-associated PD-(D/E)XK endonuclease [Isoptericola halotolerans]|uniref:group I intron-associated PD-(D/E)XK endonuclease n=1 Tax=Isoptericola halotolerans TaxID=300560 RepID=UPI00388E27A6
MLRASTAYLGRAGSLLAAAWYTLCGRDVSWPLEPSRYDLLVGTAAEVRRVQVKTTTVRVGDAWKVNLSTSRRERRTYDPDEIDDFFIVDGNLDYYVIPVAAVGGLHLIHLSAYSRFRLTKK